MQIRKFVAAFTVALVLGLVAGGVIAQNVVNYHAQGGALWVVGGTLDTTAGVLSLANGASPAATCVLGEIFIDTDETVDTNCTTTLDNSICACAPANTWLTTE